MWWIGWLKRVFIQKHHSLQYVIAKPDKVYKKWHFLTICNTSTLFWKIIMTSIWHCQQQTKLCFLYQIPTVIMIVTINIHCQNQTADKVTDTVLDERMSLNCLLFLLTTLCQSHKLTERSGGKNYDKFTPVFHCLENNSYSLFFLGWWRPRKKEKQSSRGAFARGKTQVDGAQSRVTVKIYTMYKVKNRRKMAVHVASQWSEWNSCSWSEEVVR